MISEHMITRPKAKIARERAKCLFEGPHLCFADDTILASVFDCYFLGAAFELIALHPIDSWNDSKSTIFLRWILTHSAAPLQVLIRIQSIENLPPLRS